MDKIGKNILLSLCLVFSLCSFLESRAHADHAPVTYICQLIRNPNTVDAVVEDEADLLIGHDKSYDSLIQTLELRRAKAQLEIYASDDQFGKQFYLWGRDLKARTRTYKKYENEFPDETSHKWIDSEQGEWEGRCARIFPEKANLNNQR